MKKMVLGAWMGLVALGAGATQVISLNFGSNHKAVSGSDAVHGLVSVPGTAWKDISGCTKGADTTVTGVTLYDIETGVATAADTLGVTWTGSGTWNWANVGDDVQTGYLDDNGARVRVTLANVPFTAADVLVYFNSDNSGNKFAPTEINGTLWTWDATANGPRQALNASDTWGATCQNGVVALGTNVLRVNGVAVGADGSVVIATAERATSRGSVAAVQVVEAATVTETLPAPDGEYSGLPGANPTGWFTGFNGEFKSTNLRIGPQGANVVALGNGNTPYAGYQMPAEFTCAVLLDIADVPTAGKDGAALLDFGNGGGNSLQLFKLAGEGNRVKLAYNYTADEVVVDNVPQGYHLYTITFSTTAGLSLRIDDGEILHGAQTSFNGLNAGMQFGSVYGGRPGQYNAGENCGLCMLRLWNGVASATRHDLIWELYKDLVGTPVKYSYSSNLANGSTISIPTMTDTGTHFLGADGGTMNIPSAATVNVSVLKFMNNSSTDCRFTFNLDGRVNVTSVSTGWNVYSERDTRGILTGHWHGQGTYNIRGALVGEGAFWETAYSAEMQTINIDGGLVHVRGLSANNNNSAFNVVNGGTLEIAEWNESGNGSITVHAGRGTLRAYAYNGSTGWTQPSRVGTQLTFDDADTGTTLDPNGLTIALKGVTSGAGKVVVEDSSDAGNGTVAFDSLNEMSGVVTVKGAATLRAASANGFRGTLDLQDTATLDLGASRPEGMIAFAEGTTICLRESLADENGIVSLAFTGTPHVVMVRPDGTTPIEDARVVEEDGVAKIRYTPLASPLVSGGACWYDFEFENRSLASTGVNKGSLTREGTEGIGARSGDAANDFLDDHALFTAAQSYMTISYPVQWSAAVYATVPQRANCAVMTFGTKAGGLIGLLAGAAENEVLLVRTTGDAPYEILAKMTVPNAATSQHLYVFSKRSRTIDIYLDGVLWNSYTSPTDITLGTGFQIGSVHGSPGDTGIARFGVGTFFANPADFTMEAAPAELRASYIGMLRLYDTALNSTALAALATEFPYVSPNGLFTRTVSGTDEAWTAGGAWVQVTETGTVAADAPTEGAMLQLNAGAEATALTVALDEEVHFEALAFGGAGAVTLKKGTGELMNDGKTTVNTAVTIEYGAASVAGGPLVMGANGSLTFDYRAFPVDLMTPNQTIPLTGLSTAAADVRLLAPAKTYGRTFTLSFNVETNQWQLTVARRGDAVMILVH